jgi:cell division protease FtsH
MQNNNDRQPQGGGGPNNDNNNFNFNFRNNRFALIFLVALLGMFVVMLFSNTQTVGREIPYSQFLGYLREGQVESVRILDQYEIQGQLRTSAGESSAFVTNIPYFDDSLITELSDQGGPLLRISPSGISLSG